MGDPRKLRKKYSTPSHPWQKERIDDEKILMRDYGFKNKKELWKVDSVLRKYKSQVKNLVASKDENQTKALLAKIHKMGLIGSDAVLEDILALTLKDLCERRLQTLVFKKGLSRSIKQARQFIVHEHIVIGDNKITSPSYLVDVEGESKISFALNSGLSDADHPERNSPEKMVKEEQIKAQIPPAKEPKADDKSALEELKEDVEKDKAEEMKAEEESSGDEE